MQFVLAVCSFEAGDKFAAEHTAEHSAGKEEPISWAYPGFAVWRQTACRNHTVDVWMMQQVLAPGMKNAEKANLGSQVFRIGSNLQERCGAGSKQKGVKQRLIMKRQRRECMGNCEYNVHVRNRQEFLLTGRQPLSARIVQTLRAMPVAAAIVRDGDYMTTLRTAVPMPSERCCPTTLNGG
jgi:hypothetical protein